MEMLRSSLLSLLILLQALAPYLHSHAASSSDAGLHWHFAAGVPPADGAAPPAFAPPASANADGSSGRQLELRISASFGWAPAHQARFDAAGLDDRVSEMPVEWLRDQPLFARLEAGSLAARAPPTAAVLEAPLPRTDSRPATPRFSILAYPAVAPPRQSSSG